MIVKFILNIVIWIIGFIVQISMPYVNSIQMIQYITRFLNFMFEFFQQGLNFLYLIFGDMIYIIAPSIISLLTFKYLVFPIVVIIRRIFIKGGDT